MSEVGSPARIARVLSATLQAQVALEMGANEGQAFMTEFRDRFESASNNHEEFQDLFLDMSCALMSVVQFVGEQIEQDPRELLSQLIRTYRKAVT